MSHQGSVGFSEIDTTSDLFEQLSISLDNNKFLRHKHIASKPKLKRLLKLKSSSSYVPNTTAFCTRCKKETLVLGHGGDHDQQQHIAEKEVEVRKDLIIKAGEKKVHFNKEDFDIKGEIQEKSEEKVEAELSNKGEPAANLEPSHEDKKKEDEIVSGLSNPESEAVPVHFQSVFFARRPSIIGNNEFWLPKYSSTADAVKAEDSLKRSAEPVPEVEEDATNGSDGSCATSTESALSGLTVFLSNIFKQTSKRQVKILQVATMLDETMAALTDEYFFKCKRVSTSYEIIDAIALKDVQKIMVSDTCALLVLEMGHHHSSVTEYKEFVPGYSEKTESLISLMVYAISRVKSFLLDVTRLPLLALPTCEPMKSWLVKQNEDIMYTGIATAENVSHPDYEDLSDDSFMMKIAGTNQFHPVLLLLRSGYLTSKCNGGCVSRGCKYSVTLELTKEKVSVMRREDKPWPNCVRLITTSMDITFAGSRKASVDDLMDKLYSCVRVTTGPEPSMKFQVYVLVTEHSLQMFRMTLNKAPVFGSPLLNLEIFDEDAGGAACVIDSQGNEVDDFDSLQLQNRWHLTFLDENEKLRFLTATFVE